MAFWATYLQDRTANPAHLKMNDFALYLYIYYQKKLVSGRKSSEFC